MNARRMLAQLTLAAAAAVALCSCDSPPDEDPALLTGRLWAEGKPQKKTDYVHGAIFLPRRKIGAFHRSSAYDVHFERVDYKINGKTLALTFPQTGKTAEVSFSIKACDSLPPFDLCLDLGENPWGGPKRYYGKRARKADEGAGSALEAQLAASEDE